MHLYRCSAKQNPETAEDYLGATWKKIKKIELEHVQNWLQTRTGKHPVHEKKTMYTLRLH